MALLLPRGVMAQSARLFTTSDGLPSSHIAQLKFDSQDFLWVSTDLGLSRFNGDQFTNYQAHYQMPYHLQDNQVNCLHIDNEGLYWIAGCDGLYFFDHTKNSFTRYSLSDRRQDISVSSIVDHPLRPHTLILSTYGWGMRVFDSERLEIDTIATTELQSLVPNTPPILHVDKLGHLWGFSASNFYLFDLVQMRMDPLDITPFGLIPSGFWISSVVEDEVNNCLYIGTTGSGVLRLDVNTHQLSRLPLPLQSVSSIAISPSNELFVGTETNGLWIYDPISQEVRQLMSEALANVGDRKIHSIAFDSQSNLWLGLYQRGVLMLPKRDNSVFQRQNISEVRHGGSNLATVMGFASLPNGGKAYALDGGGVVADYADGSHVLYNMSNSCMETNAVLSLASLEDGTLLAGTFEHGVYVIGPDRKVRRDSRFADLDHVSITDFENDTLEKVMYIASNGEGLFAYDYNSRQMHNVVPDSYNIKWITNLFLCSHRRLWVSRADHLSCINLKTGQIGSPRQPKSRVVINGFAETTDGELWLASNYGLLHYDNELDSLILIEDPEQQERRNYCALMNSQDGHLWLASANCITMYDPEQNRFVDYLDPAISSVGTINNHSSKRWPDQTFSFGGDNGIVNFSPQEIHQFRQPSRQLLLTRLWVDNIPTDYDPMLGADNVLDQALWCAQTLTLPSVRASFSVSYTLQNISGETGVTYSYRLKGYENEWHQSHGGSQIANYHSLPAGDYVLEVRARHENDSNEENYMIRRLNVSILPPWYATWWATSIWLLLTAVVCWYLVVQVMERRRAHHELRAAETERQVKEGKFNMLTSVSHEIKTPLTLIISPLRKMMSRKTDPATQSVLEMMYRNSLRILMLVNQQMDVRKLDRGELQLSVRELPLRSFLDDMMQYFSSMALNRHIAYSLTLPDGQDEMTVWADPTQLDKVVMNLLSNAIKFVPDAGKVSVEVSQRENGGVRITVYNSGSQLPEGQQNAAFSGIGLSIARDITELHHGTLSVRNLSDGVAFDIDLKAGKDHFSASELTDTSRSEQVVEHSFITLPDSSEVLDGERLEVVSSATIAEENKERELVEQLNDELREKQRMRERRTSLDDHNTEVVKMSSADEKLMRRVMDLIHKNMGDSEFSVEALSADLGISRVHLNRKLKELLDISPSALIKSVRLKQAALLLIQSNVTVAEVAYSVGFSSPAYFTTNFTQYYGMTPKEFTNTYTENPDSPELKQLLGQ